MLPAEISLDQQIAEVKRELRMREQVYTRRVSAGTMPELDKTRKIAVMRAVLATLERLEQDSRKQMSLGV